MFSAVRFSTILLIAICSLTACIPGEVGDTALTRNTALQLIDWHVSGFWVINCPVAWIRVTNYNNVPITDIEFKYFTYNYDGEKLNEGKYTLEGVVAPHSTKNFIEQYLGLVHLHSDKLSIQLESVRAAENNH